MSLIEPHLLLSDMDSRARSIFTDIVQGYLETGQPIGSRTLALSGGRSLSPATIRNTMADLTRFGLLSSPHVSAGRIPTHMGLRLFVDGLLEIGDLSAQERITLERHVSKSNLSVPHRDPDQILTQASSLLAGLAGGAGLVLTPAHDKGVKRSVRHVEFVNLSSEQALAVLVYSDGFVENRLMPYPAGMLPASLQQAGNFLSARLQGRQLNEARTDILEEIAQGRAEIDKAASNLIAQGLANWSDPKNKRENRALIVRGQAQLLDNLEAQSDVERIQSLFRDLEQKEDLIALLDSTEDADGVKIFIGAENTLYSLGESSVVMAPYRDAEQNIIGAVGVIGPTRLNYGRVIPVVDYTAQLVGRLFGDKKGAQNG
ncbi:MAG: heat-inducible transcriptional repressor HrcA [Maricaulaceae bacterium]